MRAALIGKPLGHSYSKLIHEKLGTEYDLLEIEKGDIAPLLKSGKYGGFNVTIPYKREVFSVLDEVDPLAEKIGAVNTVCVRNRRLIGYNTDVLGLEYMLRRADINLKDKTVMILGTGGTSRTANAAAERAGAKKVITVGRTSPVNYENCYGFQDVQVIINTTPVGMYPNTCGCPININGFKNLSAVADVIYNPLNTRLILDAKGRGLKASGGLSMLVSQAVYASALFYGQPAKEEQIERIIREIRTLSCGITLIGMPGSGKSTLGKMVAEYFNKQFTDTDKTVESAAGKSIPEIFNNDGEGVFRDLETQAVLSAAAKRNAVIATGGGAVLREENRRAMKENSVVILIERSAEKLSTFERPLSYGLEAVKKIERERMPIYRDLADFCISNEGNIEDAFDRIKEILQ